MTNSTFYKKFYTQLGKLMYVVAQADGQIQENEVDEVRKLVDSLMDLEDTTDEFGTDAAFFAEFEFEVLRDKGTNPIKVYQQFLHFIKEHQHLIDQKLKAIIFTTVEKIAQAYGGIDPEEQELIDEIRSLMA
jgi:uncharacterized tellurite resistance protein B-like protein